jgi:hypothetical protein
MPNGHHVILFDNSSYSVTTSKHQNDVLYAARNHGDIVYLPHQLWYSYIAGKEYYLSEIAKYLDKASRATINCKYYIMDMVCSLRRLQEWGRLHRRHPRYTFTDSDRKILKRASGMSTKIKIRDAKNIRRHIIDSQLGKIQHILELGYFEIVYGADLLTYWRRNGKLPPTFFMYRDLPGVHCRITDTEVITSMNARVPIDHVIRILPIIKRAIDAGKTFKADYTHPVRIGYYTLNSIESNGDITIGCHHIPWKEVEYVGKQLLPGLFGE